MSYKYRKYEINNMSKRVTIMITPDLDKKVRAYQAKIMQKQNSTYSYSKAVNDILRKCFQKM